jgi:hypothetical protein
MAHSPVSPDPPITSNATCSRRLRRATGFPLRFSRRFPGWSLPAIQVRSTGTLTVAMTSGNMQINSRWPPVLQQHGISEQTLLDPCTNTYVGAWFLARNIDRLSYGWLAAGAYNAGSQPSAWPTPEKLQRFSNGSPARDAPGHDGSGRCCLPDGGLRHHADGGSSGNGSCTWCGISRARMARMRGGGAPDQVPRRRPRSSRQPCRCRKTDPRRKQKCHL